MNGYTALLLMRAKREREASEVAKPYIAEMRNAKLEAAEERKARAHIEGVLRHKLIDAIMMEAGVALGRLLHAKIIDLVKSQRSFTATTKLEVPTDMLMSADPKSVVSRLVEWWHGEASTKMRISVNADGATEHKAQVVYFDIPALSYREVISTAPQPDYKLGMREVS